MKARTLFLSAILSECTLHKDKDLVWFGVSHAKHLKESLAPGVSRCFKTK